MQTKIAISNFWTRIWAFLIDSLILGIIGFFLGLIFRNQFTSMGGYGVLVGLSIVLIYQSVGNSFFLNGQTFGKNIMNIQVVDIEGNTIRFGRSLLRATILSVPYFTINLLIPAFSDISVFNVLKSSIFLSLLSGIVIMYILNKGTRQSIHDIIAKTYVANLYQSDELRIIDPVSKISIYIPSALAVVITGFSLYNIYSRHLKTHSILEIRSEILNLQSVYQADVMRNTIYFNNSVINTYDIEIWTNDLSNNESETEQIILFKQVASKVISNTPDLKDLNAIEVTLIDGFDIGIFSRKEKKTIRQSPDEWKSMISESP